MNIPVKKMIKILYFVNNKIARNKFNFLYNKVVNECSSENHTTSLKYEITQPQGIKSNILCD